MKENIHPSTSTSEAHGVPSAATKNVEHAQPFARQNFAENFNTIDLRESLEAIRSSLKKVVEIDQVVVLSTEIVKDILLKKQDWIGDTLAVEEMCSNISSCCIQCSQLIIDTRKRVNEILQFLDGQSQKL